MKMPKRVANAGRWAKSKPKHYKRETNLQRAARESKRQETLKNAKRVAKIICAARETKAEVVHEFLSFSWLPQGMDLSEWTWAGPKRWNETYAYLGYMCCRSNENPSKFLRLVADILEGKPLYSPGNDWYDSEITKAYEETCCRMQPGKDRTISRWRAERTVDPDGKWFPFTRPSFSEFLETFREQNPKLRGASDRSLRRSLRRLGCITRPDKRGRPKKK